LSASWIRKIDFHSDTLKSSLDEKEVVQ